jgi:hypothetical protein
MSSGGGVSLEHQYAATVLTGLMVGAPSSELGDRVQLEAVRMQPAGAVDAEDPQRHCPWPAAGAPCAAALMDDSGELSGAAKLGVEAGGAEPGA